MVNDDGLFLGLNIDLIGGFISTSSDNKLLSLLGNISPEPLWMRSYNYIFYDDFAAEKQSRLVSAIIRKHGRGLTQGDTTFAFLYSSRGFAHDMFHAFSTLLLAGQIF